MTLLGWSVTAVLAMLLVYGPHKSILPGAEEWNGAEKVLYGTFHRFLWALVLAWVTYACHYGAGGLYAFCYLENASFVMFENYVSNWSF